MDAGNWLSLLKWSIAQSGDGTLPSDATSMSKEDKEWLEEVMKTLTKDEPARMNEIMTSIVTILQQLSVSDDSQQQADDDKVNGASTGTSITNEVLESLERDLEELQDIVEQVDMAQIFAKFGGLQCLMGVISQEAFTSETRCQAAGVLATLCQNNLTVQDMALAKTETDTDTEQEDGISNSRSSLLDSLVTVYHSSDSHDLCNKVLYAISSLIRGHALLEELFIKQHFECVISQALQLQPATQPTQSPTQSVQQATTTAAAATTTATTKLITRAVFLSNALLTSDSSSLRRIVKISDVVSSAGVVCLLNYAKSLDLRETVLMLLTSMLHTAAGWNLLVRTHQRSSTSNSNSGSGISSSNNSSNGSDNSTSNSSALPSLFGAISQRRAVLLSAQQSVASTSTAAAVAVAVAGQDESETAAEIAYELKQLQTLEQLASAALPSLLYPSSGSSSSSSGGSNSRVPAAAAGPVSVSAAAVSDDEKKARVQSFNNPSALAVVPPPAPATSPM